MAKSIDVKRKNAGLKLAKALDKSAQAMLDFQLACQGLDDAPAGNRPDGREVLRRDMQEYAGYLLKLFDR